MLMLIFEFVRGLGDHDRSWKAVLVEFLAVSLFQVGLPMAHSRKLETEADRIGMVIAARAGYDPRHAATLWQRMLNEEQTPSKAVSDPLATETTETGLNEDKAQLSPSSNISSRTRLKELLSTHPCHERRIKELTLYAQELMPEYNRAVMRLLDEGKRVPNSERIIDGKTRSISASKRVENENEHEFIFEDPDKYDYGEFSLKSSRLANECAALMVGSEKENVLNFLKTIKRDNVGWGE
jgi:hypothetical protein